MESINVFLDPLNELCLVFPDGPLDVGPHKQGIVAGKDPEHFIGILCSAQLVSQVSSNPGLYYINALSISAHHHTGNTHTPGTH